MHRKPFKKYKLIIFPVVGSLLLLVRFIGPISQLSSVRAAFPGENGLIIFQSDGPNKDIFSVAPDGSGLTNLTNHPMRDEIPAISPDGTKIVFGSDRAGGPTLLYIMDVDGSNVTSLTQPPFGSGSDSHPAWSPSSNQVVFVSTRGGGSASLYLIDADGNNLVTLTPGDARADLYPNWSPDGSWITFSGGTFDQSDIYKIRPDGTELTNLTNSPDLDEDPNWSPDGTRIVFSSDREAVGGSADLWIMNADGGGLERITEDPNTNIHPTWSPDGTQIVYTSSRFEQPWGLVVLRGGCQEPVPVGSGSLYPDWQPVPNSSRATTEINTGAGYCVFAPLILRF